MTVRIGVLHVVTDLRSSAATVVVHSPFRGVPPDGGDSGGPFFRSVGNRDVQFCAFAVLSHCVNWLTLRADAYTKAATKLPPSALAEDESLSVSSEAGQSLPDACSANCGPVDGLVHSPGEASPCALPAPL